jgi:hypothetical protein
MKNLLSFIATFVIALCAVSVYAAFDSSPPPNFGGRQKYPVKNCTASAAAVQHFDAQRETEVAAEAETAAAEAVRAKPFDAFEAAHTVLPDAARQEPEIVRKI